MRQEYDFPKGVRGATAARYAAGANVVVIEPALLDVFPDASSVNDALRAQRQLHLPINDNYI